MHMGFGATVYLFLFFGTHIDELMRKYWCLREFKTQLAGFMHCSYQAT